MGKAEESTVDDRGRILIPKEIRDKLGLQSGRNVQLTIEDDRLIVTPPVSPEKFIEELEGVIVDGEPEMDPLRLKDIWGKLGEE
ncbi:MAG: AbrB/MazE/SpoVT family DNA-binding domain-containing protein [Candidatus Bathyarchaeota archaeon]|nr:AbrB/MazE/SpoVT family DNA-binding domain-containing protein [Candidatus Bathyarchaeota archaeon]